MNTTLASAGQVPAEQPMDPGKLDPVFTEVRSLVLPALRSAVDLLPPLVRDVVGYHLGWQDETGLPTDGSPGKLLRPALTLLCAQAVGAPASCAVDAAVAVELVHNFSLLHDDVMDGDATRRHRRTAWSVFGVPTAILAGDALLALALEVLAESPLSVSTLCVALRELVGGQSLDVWFERRDDISVEECLAMAGGKTASLLRCACELGAAHGGGTPGQVSALRRFGWHVGLAFQLIDDLLGIWGDPTLTGKPSLSDLRARKKSLPVVAALAAGGSSSGRLADLYWRSGPLGERDLAAVAELVELAGGRAWAQIEADRHMRQAVDHLMASEPTGDSRAALTAFAVLVTQRDR